MLLGFSLKGRAEDTTLPAGFRPDIQGLRALAVLAVVFYHLRVSAFRGGFTGVDIFFVISGYLITRNILVDIRSGHFSFLTFYARRIRRIFPAMLATVAVTIVAGALWFPPSDYVGLAETSFSSLAFVSNVYFWWNSQNYFLSDTSFMPLLHLWSLSVEEQFYIFWPLLIFAISSARAARLALYMCAIGLVSFTAVYIFKRFDQSGNFYLMPFRVYQFALGALVLFMERTVSADTVNQRAAQGLGLALCVIGIFVLSPTSHVTSMGVVSSVGAALIIVGGGWGASIPVLTNPVAAYIGRISYSLYLVHWPVSVFVDYIYGEQVFGLAGLGIQLIIIFILAALMHHFIERPFLSSHNAPRKAPMVRLLLTVSLVLALVSTSIIAGDGWNWRLNKAQQRRNDLEAFGVAPCMRDATFCTFGAKSGTRTVMLIGDSHAQHYVSAIDKIASRLNVHAEENIQQGCLVLSGLVRLGGYTDDRCRIGRDRVLAAAKKSTAPVIISQAWMGYMNGSIGDDNGRVIDVRSEQKRLDVLRNALDRTINEIERPNRRILIIGAQVMALCDIAPTRLGDGPLPHKENAPCKLRTHDDARRATIGVDNMLAKVQAEYPGIVSLILPVDYMCDVTCPIVDDGIWLYQDGSHLTVAGSLRFGERANNAISSFLLDGIQSEK